MRLKGIQLLSYCEGIQQYTFLIVLVPSGPVQDINTTVLSSEEAVISWNAPDVAEQNGIITGYVINITHANTGQSFQRMSSSNELFLTDLQPFTTYTCRIAARTSMGVGPYSFAVSFLTEETGMCERVVV